MPVELIIGGARSGKSSFAENRVSELIDASEGLTKHYVATSEPIDNEMRARIEHHRRQRGLGWREWECPLALVEQLSTFSSSDVVLIDCLTLWLNNHLFHLGDNCDDLGLMREIETLVKALAQCDAHVIVVSNEVGLGVVPMGEVSRLFVDNGGRMNQQIAKIAEKVVFVAAGLPLVLK